MLLLEREGTTSVSGRGAMSVDRKHQNQKREKKDQGQPILERHVQEGESAYDGEEEKATEEVA